MTTISNARKAQMRDKIRTNFGGSNEPTARELALDLADTLDALDKQAQTITGLTTDRGTTIGSLGAWDIGRTIAFEWNGTYMRGRLDDIHAHHDGIVRYGEDQNWISGQKRTTVNLIVGGHRVVLIEPDTPCEVTS